MENKNEFDYVFEACAGKIHPAAIADLLSVPEFEEALRAFDGQVDNKVIYELAERTYSKAKLDRNSNEFKQSVISKRGVEGWLEYKKQYRNLCNGHRKARLSVK